MTAIKEPPFQTNCICCTCGTSMEDSISGFCDNGHDDWLELEDGASQYRRASINLNIPIDELMEKLLILNK